MWEVFEFWSSDIIRPDFSQWKENGVLAHLEKWNKKVHNIATDNIWFRFIADIIFSNKYLDDKQSACKDIVFSQLDLTETKEQAYNLIQSLQYFFLYFIENCMKTPVDIKMVNDLIFFLGNAIKRNYNIDFFDELFLLNISDE